MLDLKSSASANSAIPVTREQDSNLHILLLFYPLNYPCEGSGIRTHDRQCAAIMWPIAEPPSQAEYEIHNTILHDLIQWCHTETHNKTRLMWNRQDLNLYLWF